VYICRENDARNGWDPEVVLFDPGVPLVEVDMAFDQNGRPFACAEVAGEDGPEVWLYWYNSVLGDFEFAKMADGRNPRLVLDDPVNTDESDVLLYYISDVVNHLCYRVQRELYAIENLTPITRVSNYFLEDVALSRQFRLLILGSVRDPLYGTYGLAKLESAPYPFRFTEGIDHGHPFDVTADVMSVLIIHDEQEAVQHEHPSNVVVTNLPLVEVVPPVDSGIGSTGAYTEEEAARQEHPTNVVATVQALVIRVSGYDDPVTPAYFVDEEAAQQGHPTNVVADVLLYVIVPNVDAEAVQQGHPTNIVATVEAI
jgi:hypothetical protein